MFYADDTIIIITCPSSVEFSTKVNTVFADINEWFRSNLLSFNFNKTYFLQFRTKTSQKIDLNITLLNKHITNTTDEFDAHVTVHRDKFLTTESTICTNFSNFYRCTVHY